MDCVCYGDVTGHDVTGDVNRNLNCFALFIKIFEVRPLRLVFRVH
jgi:hypothetical protein